MTTANDVFQRTEKKYHLSAQQRQALTTILDTRMEPDRFGKTTISSLYLDTPQYDLICRSLEKPLYKEKLRIRHYGPMETLRGTDDVFIEIKKKFKGVVYKRRVNLTWDATRAFLGGMDYVQACTRFPQADTRHAQESVSPRSLQIAREIEAFLLSKQSLEPSMILACDRTALRLKEGPSTSHGSNLALAGQGELRITFDGNIRYRNLRERADSTPRHANISTPAGSASAHASAIPAEHALLPAGDSIMEVKMVGAMPLWLSRALASYGIRPCSYSKYGEAYQAAIA